MVRPGQICVAEAFLCPCFKRTESESGGHNICRSPNPQRTDDDAVSFLIEAIREHFERTKYVM